VSSLDSVTEWLRDLKQGNSFAAHQLWQRYVERLIRLADRKLGSTPRRASDEEDVVIAAFASFCQGVDAGQFGRLDDRNDLWQVLVVLTERKANDQKRRHLAAKRGGGRVSGESVFEVGNSCDTSTPGISRIADRGPTPEFAAEAIDQLRALLHALQDDTLRQLAIAKLEAHSNEEIARQLGISLRSVERRLGLIRQIWREGLGDEHE
jgi:DNA-directed RNA polymerase specialized sigma24 family protein